MLVDNVVYVVCCFLCSLFVLWAANVFQLLRQMPRNIVNDNNRSSMRLDLILVPLYVCVCVCVCVSVYGVCSCAHN